MFLDVIGSIGFGLLFVGMASTTASEFLFLRLVKEINARRLPAQQIKSLNVTFIGSFQRREKRRTIMRVHQDLFPNNWKRDGFDNSRFFGILSSVTGFALIVISGFL